MVQYHFHTPAEHAFDSRRAPMEAHLVHKNMRTGCCALPYTLCVCSCHHYPALLQMFRGNYFSQCKKTGLVYLQAAWLGCNTISAKHTLCLNHSGRLTKLCLHSVAVMCSITANPA